MDWWIDEYDPGPRALEPGSILITRCTSTFVEKTNSVHATKFTFNGVSENDLVYLGSSAQNLGPGTHVFYMVLGKPTFCGELQGISYSDEVHPLQFSFNDGRNRVPAKAKEPEVNLWTILLDKERETETWNQEPSQPPPSPSQIFVSPDIKLNTLTEGKVFREAQLDLAQRSTAPLNSL
jgi:hypothetical protein